MCLGPGTGISWDGAYARTHLLTVQLAPTFDRLLSVYCPGLCSHTSYFLGFPVAPPARRT